MRRWGRWITGPGAAGVPPGTAGRPRVRHPGVRDQPGTRRGPGAGPGGPASEMNGGKQGTRGRATQVRDAMACLDALAAQLRARGWTAYLVTPSGRVAPLVVLA